MRHAKYKIKFAISKHQRNFNGHFQRYETGLGNKQKHTFSINTICHIMKCNILLRCLILGQKLFLLSNYLIELFLCFKWWNPLFKNIEERTDFDPFFINILYSVIMNQKNCLPP